jgi:hypothetical protein
VPPSLPASLAVHLPDHLPSVAKPVPRAALRRHQPRGEHGRSRASGCYGIFVTGRQRDTGLPSWSPVSTTQLLPGLAPPCRMACIESSTQRRDVRFGGPGRNSARNQEGRAQGAAELREPGAELKESLRHQVAATRPRRAVPSTPRNPSWSTFPRSSRRRSGRIEIPVAVSASRPCPLGNLIEDRGAEIGERRVVRE